MKHALLPAAALAAVVSVAVPLASAFAATEPNAADRKLLELRRSVWIAWFEGDSKALERLLPADGLYVSPGTAPWETRSATMERASKFRKDGGKLVSLEFPKNEIRHYGSTALIFSTFVMAIESEGKTSRSEGTVLEVFVREGSSYRHPSWCIVPPSSAK